MTRIVSVAIGSMALGLDAYVIAGILPAIGANLRLPVSAVGQLVTVFTLCYALLAPIAATLLQRAPMRAVLLTALLVFTVGNALGALATNLPLLLVSRVVAGVGAGVYSPTAAATAAALVESRRRGRALAMITGAMSVGIVAGTPVGVLLAEHAGWRATFWLVAALDAIAWVNAGMFLPPIAPVAVPSLRARIDVLVDRRVVSILLVALLSATASLGVYTYLAPVLRHTLGVVGLAGYLWMWGLGGLAGNIVIGQLIDRWSNTRLLVSVVLLVLGGTLLVLPVLATSPAGALTLLFVWGMAAWAMPAPLQHRLLAERGGGRTAVSLNASALYLGAASGAAVGGLIFALGGGAATLTTIFGLTAILTAAVNQLCTAQPTTRSSSVESVESIA